MRIEVNIRKNNCLSEKIDVTDKKAEYDENVKWLLSEKIVLAHILVYAVKEYEGMNPTEVVCLIENNPLVGMIPVNPGESNTYEITGEKSESIIPGEGKITYDIRFRAWLPDKSEKIQLIVDVEAQKNYYPGYDLIARGVFYGARMISAQMGTEFVGDDYNKLKKVYSIWICMDSPKFAENTITEYSMHPKNLIGNFPSSRGKYDLLSVVMVCLSKDLAVHGENTKLHRFLGALLSSKMTKDEKKNIIEREYNIPLTHEIERKVNIMCNLSDIIEERGIEKGIEKGIEEGIIIFIKDKLEDNVQEDRIVEKLVKNYMMSDVKAEQYIKCVKEKLYSKI